MKKRQFIYVPEIHPTSFVLFFSRGESESSWSIRDFASPATAPCYGRLVGQTAQQVLALSRRPGCFALDAPTHNTKDHKFWRDAIRLLNATYLRPTSDPDGAAQPPAAPDPPAPTPSAAALEPAPPLPQAGPFPIYAPSGEVVRSVDHWGIVAGPAGGAGQWHSYRSAQELARRWIGGTLPPEVATLLATNPATRDFVAEAAHAEVRIALDNFRGNTRNADLVVKGRCGSVRVNLDVEGKADEPFGPTITERLIAAERTLQHNPRSQAAVRVRTLSRAVFGTEAEQVGGLRYQLLHGLAGAVASGQATGRERVVFLVHEFCSAATSAANLARNTADLEAVAHQLGGAPAVGVLRNRELLGPFHLPGNEWIPSKVELYIGKASCDLP